MRKIHAALVMLIVSGAVLAPVHSADAAQRVAKDGRTGRRESPKAAKVRASLHRNLDGKADGFISSWTWRANTFTLTIDPARYSENRFSAVAMAIRAIFETDGIPLPRRFVVRTVAGETLADSSFDNVPSLVN